MSVNKVILLGRLGKDPELRETSSGHVCKFSLATDKGGKQRDAGPDWHNVVAFNKTAELIAKYLKKGDQCYIEGRLNYSSYEKDGEKRYFTEVVVDVVKFIGGGKSGGGTGEGSGGGGAKPKRQTPKKLDMEYEAGFDSSEVPF